MDKPDKKQKILDAALEVFARYGYRKATLEDVAAAVGMTKGNLYFYVKNKQDLYTRAVAGALEEWRMAIAADMAAASTVTEKFRVAARRSFEYLKKREDLRALLMRDPEIFTLSRSEDRFFEVNQRAMGMLRQVIQEGVDEGVFHPMDVDAVTEFLFSVYIMFLIKTYVKSDAGSGDRMYQAGLELIFRGLCR